MYLCMLVVEHTMYNVWDVGRYNIQRKHTIYNVEVVFSIDLVFNAVITSLKEIRS